MDCLRRWSFLRAFLLPVTIISVWFLQQPRPVNANQQKNKPTGESSQSIFVTYQTERGVSSRELSKAEAARISQPQEADFAGKPPITIARTRSAPNQNLFRFTLTSTAQLDAAPQAKAAVERALTKWAEAFDNDLSVPVRVDFGATLFGNPFPTSDTVAVTAVEFAPASYVFLPQLLTDRTYDLQQQALYEAFPQGAFRTELGLASRLRIPAPLAKVTGSVVVGFNNPFTIGFNSNKKYDFDPSDGIDADKLDFEALVLREVGRALGFVSSVGSAEAKLDSQPEAGFHDAEALWDLFRFRDHISLAEFNIAQRTQLSGGKQVFFAGGQELLLSTGRPDGKGGDGRPAGHWKDDELTGQYIGIMDPTYAPGERGAITANDLSALDYLGYTIFASTPVTQVLSNDDNSAEETLTPNGAMVVSRLLPSRYPCEVQAVRLRLPQTGINPTGQQIRLVIFNDPARTGQPPANPTLLLDRTITIAALPENRMLELVLPNGPKIDSGDLYVGVQVPSGVALAGDANVEQQRSFITTDNAASFQPLKTSNQQPVNLMARAVVKATYGDPAVPEIASFSPNSISPGEQGFTLYVYGKNFYGIDGGGFKDNSVVRWNGQERETEFLNGSLLRATITEADVASAGTAKVTVLTKTGLNEILESAAVAFSIKSERPVPTLDGLFPPGAQTGGNDMTLAILGKNFTRESVVRWNGVERTANFYSSTEISLPVTKADLANAANVEISVFTPGPGGGVSSKATFVIAPCQFKLSTVGQDLPSYGGGRDVLVMTQPYCRWTAESNVPWATISGQSTGLGQGLFNVTTESNFADGGRTGQVSVGDARFNIRQSGYAKAVSAASFTSPLAPESIASIFSLGITNTIGIASTNPLPTKLNNVEIKVRSALAVERIAPLFFTSPEQINFQIPAGTTAGNATIFVNVNGVTRSYGTVQIASVAPGLFTANSNGSGVAAAVALRVRADGSQSYEPVAEFDPVQNRIVARPIDLGAETDKVYLLMFGTGLRNRTALSGVKVKIDGVEADVSFAGAQPDYVGLDQINMQLPATLRGRGEVTINCTVDGKAANAVTITLK